MKPANHRVIFWATVVGFFEPVAWVVVAVSSVLGRPPMRFMGGRAAAELTLHSLRAAWPPNELILELHSKQFSEQSPRAEVELFNWLLRVITETRQMEVDAQVEHIKKQQQWRSLVKRVRLEPRLFVALLQAWQRRQREPAEDGRNVLGRLFGELYLELLCDQALSRKRQRWYGLQRRLMHFRLGVLLRFHAFLNQPKAAPKETTTKSHES